MKILVTGSQGQLGYDVIQTLQNRCIPCKGVDMADFDITDAAATAAYLQAYAPDVVIHCAAYTAVDRAEDDRDTCYAVNVAGTENIAAYCGAHDVKLLYISTDYVYGGSGDAPMTVTDPTHPCNVYGETKLLGEAAVLRHCAKYFIIRTSWVFGNHGANFVKTMLRLADTHAELRVVADQVGSPTYTPDLARLLCDMAASEKYGVYHATNEGFCSWFEFAQAIMQFAGKDTNILPVSTDEYGAKAARPLNSRLSKQCLTDAGFALLPPWQDALQRFLLQMAENK